jgi:hypothetical protein
MENMYFTPFAFEIYDFQNGGGNFLERITNNIMKPKQLKYGAKDGITGRNKRGELIQRPESKMTATEIEYMFKQINHRRGVFVEYADAESIDTRLLNMEYVPENLPNYNKVFTHEFRETEMIG